MLERIRNSAAAMTAIVRRQEITANNLANVNTAGYRKDRLFEELLSDATGDNGILTSSRQLTTWTDQTHGNYEFTGRPLDVTIGGPGYFVVQDEASGRSYYTRAGHFSQDIQGQLVDSSGRTVTGQSGPITIPPHADSVRITQTGAVMAGSQEVGRIRVVDFESTAELRRVDGASFDADGATPTDVDEPALKAGYVEQSNVNALSEMASMVQDSRLFESQQRALRTLDQTLERAIRDLGQY